MASRARGLIRSDFDGEVVDKSALDFEVFRRRLASIFNHFVFKGLPLIEAIQSSPLDCRDVNENILAATLRLNEPVTLRRIEPFHSTSRHYQLLRGTLPIHFHTVADATQNFSRRSFNFSCG